MNISARCEYACRAMAELALHHGDGAVITVQELANRRHIPEKYLVHILLQLKRAGLVASVRGAQGGYSLSESPDRITLLQIVTAIDGPVLTPLPVDDGRCEEVKAVWARVAGGVQGLLEKISLRQMAEFSGREPMYYI